MKIDVPRLPILRTQGKEAVAPASTPPAATATAPASQPEQGAADTFERAAPRRLDSLLDPRDAKASLAAEREGDASGTVGDDAQLANVDLQDAVQRQQQVVQMLSNISKALYGAALATIRKLGG